ncbi:alkaline phosphatase [Shewanella cyperi]|uniref:Alkaline phosphatase n=1 Tax=Shewanella cyperi TaxID=2814292 RepID=A0A974XLC4_9GAMM|nr:alkaline phosphatase [Shewanella cyperi]
MSLRHLSALLLCLPLCAMAADGNALVKTNTKPKNLVIMIGDGMGPAYTSAYRYFKDNPETEEIEQTVFDRLLVGMASTYPARESGYVTDSAAAATALSTGYKSYNGAIAVDTEHKPLTTLMEHARGAGLATGIAVSCQINHATPAAFLSHNDSRRNYDAIAESYLDSDAQVLLGGGQRYFPDALLARFRDKGYQTLSEFDQLDGISSGKVLGLFADVQLPWAMDEPQAHKLSKLTAKALELLSAQEQGFVLLVEGSLIDWAGHGNDIAAAMGEMNEFANAIEVVEQYVRSHGDTLMVVTADHNTGGMSIGAAGEYKWTPEVLRTLNASPETMATMALANEDWQQPLAQQLAFAPSADEYAELAKARMQGKDVLESAIKRLIDVRSNTGWTTGGHTGVDVQVFAAGPASSLFNGHQDNTDIAQKLMSLLPREAKKSVATTPDAKNEPQAEAQPLKEQVVTN